MNARNKEHQAILSELYCASAYYPESMKPDRWLSIIQHKIHDKYGFYPAIHQVRYALKKMSKRGDMLEHWHERGWYKWYTYKWNPDRIPF